MINSLPPATEHHCALFYFSHQLDNPERFTFSDLASSNPKWLQEQDEKRIATLDRQKSLWRPTDYSVSSDYYPHIRLLLENSNVRQTAWQPTDQLLRLLHGKNLASPKEATHVKRQPSRLELVLSDAAINRLRQAGHAGANDRRVFMKIRSIQLHQLTPGFYTIVIHVFFQGPQNDKLHPAWILEAVYHLSRFSKCRWILAVGGNDALPTFSLGHVVRSLIGDTARDERRVYSSTFVRFEQPTDIPLPQELAARLSRHYTSDYRVSVDRSDYGTLTDFDTVTHLVCLEGSATVVYNDEHQSSSALVNFYTDSFLKSYLPLNLLAFHECHTLLAYSQEVQALYKPGDKEHKQAAALKKFLDKTLQFRLRFQHPAVSAISMHNQYYEQLRSGFHLDRLLAKLENDSADMSDFVQAYQHAESDRKMRWFSAMATGGVTFLTVFAIFDETMKAVPALHTMAEKLMEAVTTLHGAAGLVPVIAGSLAGLAAFLLLMCLRYQAAHVQREAVEEIIKHQVLE